MSTGRHVLSAEFALRGRSDDPATPGFIGTVTLYVDDEPAGKADIVTQPGAFCLVGDGICVGRDSASPVTPDYTAPFPFTGGTIDRVIVDVSGEPFLDHEREVMAWIMRD
jgi:arylsulfatase